MSFRAVAARSLLFFALAGGVATPAFAQHVVTDDEAGKLTLDALTATPAPVHRVSYRALSRRSVYLPAAARVRMGSRSAVHTVSFRHAAHTPAGKSGAHHGKGRRG